MSTERHPRLLPVAEEARVTPIELFFDLVFVFSLTQVTALMGHHLSGHAILRGLLVLALLWWCWVGYAWLGNVVQAEEGLGRAAMFTAMAAMFVMALAVPEAFDDLPGGLDGPVVVAFAYLAIRLLHLAMFWLAARTEHDRGLRAQLLLFMPSLFGSTAILLVASQLEGTAQTLAWVGAILVDYVGVILGGASGWRLRSASHFAERHGLIVIVALGESIVAIGVGVAHLPISWPIIAGSVLGLAVVASVWWAYFDVVSIVAERVLRRLQGEERTRMARDAYSYLHLPMVAGIALLALGIEQVLGQRRRDERRRALRATRRAAARRPVRGCRALPGRARGVQVPDLAPSDGASAPGRRSAGRVDARGDGATRARGARTARRRDGRDDRDRVGPVLGGPRADPS